MRFRGWRAKQETRTSWQEITEKSSSSSTEQRQNSATVNRLKIFRPCERVEAVEELLRVETNRYGNLDFLVVPMMIAILSSCRRSFHGSRTPPARSQERKAKELRTLSILVIEDIGRFGPELDFQPLRSAQRRKLARCPNANHVDAVDLTRRVGVLR